MTTWTWSYPEAGSSVGAGGVGSPGPHGAVSVTRTAAEPAPGAFEYSYDPAGNLISRPSGIDPGDPVTSQALAWGADGRLDRVVVDAGGAGEATSSYDYGPSGSRVLRVEGAREGVAGSAETTLYLGATEITAHPEVNADGQGHEQAGTVTSRRYYPAGALSVLRESSVDVSGTESDPGLGGTVDEDPALRVLAADHHGTTTVQIDARRAGTADPAVNAVVGAEVAYRFLDPYGDPLAVTTGLAPGGSGEPGGELSGREPEGVLATSPTGTSPTGTSAGASGGGVWRGQRGFVGGTTDAALAEGGSGLTQIGYRAYDSQSGMFLSPDPVADTANGLQLAAVYGYGNANPLTWSDPSGLVSHSRVRNQLSHSWKAARKRAALAAHRARIHAAAARRAAARRAAAARARARAQLYRARTAALRAHREATRRTRAAIAKARALAHQRHRAHAAALAKARLLQTKHYHAQATPTPSPTPGPKPTYPPPPPSPSPSPTPPKPAQPTGAPRPSSGGGGWSVPGWLRRTASWSNSVANPFGERRVYSLGNCLVVFCWHVTLQGGYLQVGTTSEAVTNGGLPSWGELRRFRGIGGSFQAGYANARPGPDQNPNTLFISGKYKVGGELGVGLNGENRPDWMDYSISFSAGGGFGAGEMHNTQYYEIPGARFVTAPERAWW